MKGINGSVTTHTYDSIIANVAVSEPDTYDLYIEWGTASVFLPYEKISEKLKTYLRDYKDPHGGVRMRIFPDLQGKNYRSKMDLLNPENQEMRQEIFACLGMKPDTEFDEFANVYNGLTSREIGKRLS